MRDTIHGAPITTRRMPSLQPARSGTGRTSRPSLGALRRARRERLQPEDFHFQRGRRRAPGLRREEVAQLCGICATCYTWIEQGRATAISLQTLHASADGLRLSRAAREYLLELGGRTDPSAPPEPSDPRPLLALVRSSRAPACLIDRRWDALVCNRPAAELFADWLGRRGERNLLRYVFLDADAPHCIVEWPERSRRLVAE